MPKPEKLDAVAGLKELFESSPSFFVTDFQGLNVTDITALRRNLRLKNVKYLVAKNTLFRIAAREAGIPDGVEEHFAGPTAVAFVTEDPVPVAKILHDSYKDKELPRTKVFVVDAHVHGSDDVKRLADLPPTEILLSQIAAAVESPITSVVYGIEALFRELIGSVDALARQRESEG